MLVDPRRSLARFTTIRESPAWLVGLVTLALAALIGVATLLTGYYRDARAVRADTHLQRGQALVSKGDLRNGIVELRAALTLNRQDPAYALTLATALLENSLPREAGPYLDEAIAADPTSGPANLARARTARALGAPDAGTYYQRAYFGSWPIDQHAHRIAVGFELTELLLGAGDRERARGMLAQLAVDVARDADALLRVAQLLAQAGAPQDAQPLLREIVARRPGDEEAWTALARVTFERHQYASAIEAAEHWLELQPKNAEAAAILSVAREVRALDPTGPRLSAREQTRRAQVLLRQTIAAVDACAPPPAVTPAPSADTPPDTVRAEALRALERGQASVGEEQLVDLAMRLWAVRQARCPPADVSTDVLARVFATLAATEQRR